MAYIVNVVGRGYAPDHFFNCSFLIKKMIYLMSTTIITTPGMWEVVEISQESARKYLENEFISAVGHESTAELISTLLKKEINCNRITVQAKPGDTCVCFKLNSRPPEGKILSKEDLENLEFSWFTMDLIQ